MNSLEQISEGKRQLLAKLAQVQAELKAPKRQKNNYGGYNYRSCEDILEAVKPLLAERGLVLIINDSIEQVGERYYVKATATIYASDGSEVSNSALAREELTRKGMDASQITGATSSYARKYALNGLLAIDDTKDADSSQGGQEEKPKPQASMTRGKALSSLKKEPTLESLRVAYAKLPAELRADKEVLEYCKQRAKEQ